MDRSGGDERTVRLRAELERSRRRIADLEVLGDTVELLDASLEPSHLMRLALRLALRVLHGDVALLVTRDAGRETAHYLSREEGSLTALPDNPSRLAHEVLLAGRGGTRRGTGSPGSRAAAERLGSEPVLRVAVPLVRRGRVLGVLEVGYAQEPEERFRTESPALRSVAEHLAIALDNAALVRDHARRLRESELLHDISAKISAHLDLDKLLDAIVDSILELIEADAVGIFLIDRDDRSIRKETLRGYGESDIDEVRLKVGRGILGWVAREGEGIIVGDVSKDARYVAAREGTRSEMAAPLRYEDRIIGVFNLESDRLDAFEPRDLELLTAFGNHAAISIMNAHLHSEVTEKRRLEEQLAVARDIQTRLLPGRPPRIAGHCLVGRNIPSSAVGGDYFDFVPLTGGRWAIVVADVSGNGLPAGLIMAGFRAEVRARLRLSDDPRDVLEDVNRGLCDELETGHFVTAFVGVYDPSSGELVYANGGHEPGLLVRAAGAPESLTVGGLLLGVFPEAPYEAAKVVLEPGDRLLLYTDGLSDAGDPWGESLGVEGVLRLLGEVTEFGTEAAGVPQELLARAEREAAEPTDESDDRTLVLLERLAVVPAAPAGP